MLQINTQYGGKPYCSIPNAHLQLFNQMDHAMELIQWNVNASLGIGGHAKFYLRLKIFCIWYTNSCKITHLSFNETIQY